MPKHMTKRRNLYELNVKFSSKENYKYQIFRAIDIKMPSLVWYEVYLNNVCIDRFETYPDAKDYIVYHKNKLYGGLKDGKNT